MRYLFLLLLMLPSALNAQVNMANLTGTTGNVQTNIDARLPISGGIGTNETFLGTTMISDLVVTNGTGPWVKLTGDTMTGPLAIGGGTVTANAPALVVSQTWNNGAVVFSALRVNITPTALAGGSTLIDLQTSSVSRFNVSSGGTVTAGGNAIFSGSLYLGAAADAILVRSAANSISLRNGANAQTLIVQGSYTDSGNYRQLRQTMTTGGAATIAAEGLGTGVSGNTITFSADSGITFANAVLINNGVNLTFATANGTKLGTATTQKLGFWNATPIVQPSSTGETTGFTAGGGTGVTDSSTFTGNVGSTAYRISDIVKHLKNAGLISQ